MSELRSEVLAPGDGQVQAAVIARPFSASPQVLQLPAGLSLGEMVELTIAEPWARLHAWVAVNGETVPPFMWARVRPKPGTAVAIRVLPAGGGGRGGGGKNILSLVVSIAVVAASLTLPALLPAVVPGLGIAWGSVAAIGVSVVGGLLVSALAPPPPQIGRIPGAQPARLGVAGDATPAYSVTAGQNGYSLYGTIPRVFGRHRIFPPLAARSYTEIAGNDQYLRMLVCWGYGPLQIEDLRIGETPLSDYQGVEVQTRQGYLSDSQITLFSNSVYEETLAIDLNSSGGRDDADDGEAQVPEDLAWTERTTQPETDSISVDILCPRGAYWIDAEGDYRPVRILVYIQYRPVGGGSWTSVEDFNFGENRTTPARHSRSWSVSRGQYEVRLAWAKTSNLDPGKVNALVDNVTWTALRSVRSVHPINMPGLALTALRIKASEEIQGTIDRLNGIVTSILPDWNGSDWSTVRATRNPASAFRAILTEEREGSVAPAGARANANPIPAARLDATNLAAFHSDCETNGYNFDYVLAGRSSVFQLLKTAAAAGRAAPQVVDGTWRVLMDRSGGSPVQHFTPRNSWGFSSEKAFPILPHAFRVRFANELEDWQDDERFVYDDGYAAGNATIFEELELPGTTHPDKVWELGRYHLAAAKLRPETYSWQADIEHLVCTRGSLVRLTHDAMLVGQGAARVTARTLDGLGGVTSVTVDNRLEAESGKSYMLAMRDATGACRTYDLANGFGIWDVLSFPAAVPEAEAPQVGDLVTFGEAEKVYLDLRVREILPSQDNTAQILAVDDAPAIQDAISGTIPPYNPKLSPRFVELTPPAPRIESVQSDETVLVRDAQGVLQPRVVIAYAIPGGYLALVSEVEVEARVQDTDTPFINFRQPVRDGVVALDGVIEGVDIEFRLRFRAPAGPGPWTAWTPHTIIGQSTLPPDVANLRVESGVLRCSYPTPPLDLAGFKLRIRFGNDRRWADATPTHDGLLSVPEFPLAELPSGTLTCLMKAVDQSGRESATAAFIILALGDALSANVVRTLDRRAAGWPGTLTGGAIETEGHIAASSSAAAWSGDDMAPAWSGDLDAPAWEGAFAAMTYLDAIVPELADLPCDLLVSIEASGEPWRLEYRTGGAAAAWSENAAPAWTGNNSAPAWAPLDAWRPWPGRLPVSRQSYELRVTTGAGTTRGRVDQLRFELDVEDRVERLDDVAIAPGGTRLPITPGAFRFITNVQMTLQDIGTGAVTIRTLDKDISGPLVAAYDLNGDNVTAEIDALVQGAAA